MALRVDGAATSAPIAEASGPAEAAEFVTAWHGAPEVPSHEPSPREPPGSADTARSRPVAALVTRPVHTTAPSQANTPPEAEAPDGPAGIRAVLAGWSGPASARAAPGPVDAVDTDRTRQVPPPDWQLASPVEVRGRPSSTASSRDAEEVCTDPEHCGEEHARSADTVEVEDGPLVGWPGTGCPVAGSAGACFAALLSRVSVRTNPSPPLTSTVPDPDEPLAFPPATEESEPLPELFALPVQVRVAPSGQCTHALELPSTLGAACATGNV